MKTNSDDFDKFKYELRRACEQASGTHLPTSIITQYDMVKYHTTALKVIAEWRAIPVNQRIYSISRRSIKTLIEKHEASLVKAMAEKLCDA
jgi:hypothetical protein